jgi:hypothetical protein
MDNDNWKDLDPAEAIHVWQYFDSVGGTDKNRMVTVSTWLLTFSGGILGYAITQGLKGCHDWESALLAILGLLISVFSAQITLLYGGYANRNWERADAIARINGWCDLLPEESSRVKSEIDRRRLAANSKSLARWARRRAKPHDPAETFAPIFWRFIVFSTFSFLFHGAVLVFCLLRIF